MLWREHLLPFISISCNIYRSQINIENFSVNSVLECRYFNSIFIKKKTNSFQNGHSKQLNSKFKIFLLPINRIFIICYMRHVMFIIANIYRILQLYFL